MAEQVNKHGHPGITYHAKRDRWRARVRRDGKSYFKYGRTPEEAAAKYEELCKLHPRKEPKKRERREPSEETKAKSVAARKAYYEKNKEKLNTARRERKEKEQKQDPVAYAKKRAEYSAAYKERNPDKSKEYYRRTREAQLASAKKRYAGLSDEKKKKKRTEEYERNKDKYIEKAAARRALKASQTPAWAAPAAATKFYQLKKIADARKLEGEDLHIDHTVPLYGMAGGIRVVCGLHVSANLRLIPAKDNLKKGCTTWPDQPTYTEEDLNELKKLQQRYCN